MSAIPICHRSKACWHCTETAGNFRCVRSLRPWRGRFERGRGRGRWDEMAFVCQGCIERAAVVLAGVNQTERDNVLRRAQQRKGILCHI